MASDTKELGRYSQTTESQSGNGRPHDKSRSLEAEEVDIIRMCAGCGKNMRRHKRFVCPCKRGIHCSKECANLSKHRCGELIEVTDQVSTEEDIWFEDYRRNISAKFVEVIDACVERYRYDRSRGEGPSSKKVALLMKGTKGNHQRILKHAESRNPAAAYVVGSAYVERNFDQQRGFAIPHKYKKKSRAETNEIAVKWLKVAAEHERGIPEAMFLLFQVLTDNCGLRVDRRVAEYWLAQAHASGEMEYLIQLLEIPKAGYCFPTLLLQIEIDGEAPRFQSGSSLADLLMAARFWEIKALGGKTGMDEPFYGWTTFNSIAESIGEIDNDKPKPPFNGIICGKKKTVTFISSRNSNVSTSDKRGENNLKFKHGAKSPVSHDFELVRQTKNLGGRTKYLIICKHDEVKLEPSMNRTKFQVKYELTESVMENFMENLKSAGECVSCTEEARQRLSAVSLGLFSLSLTPVHYGMQLYAARYANADGIIVQDVFGAYSKPSVRQTLQCLMSNPADLHPLAVAEDKELFWPIIWFWGSVYEAVEDACNNATLGAIYHSLGDKSSANLSDKKTTSKSVNSSAMEAFPEDAAGEWRIACGNDDCPRVDHEVKFQVCTGCRVRRYCGAACQKKDMPKHSKFCAAAGGAPGGKPEGMGGMPGGMGGGTAGAGLTIEEVE